MIIQREVNATYQSGSASDKESHNSNMVIVAKSNVQAQNNPSWNMYSMKILLI